MKKDMLKLNFLNDFLFRLVKGRQKARERKLHMIGKLLDQIRSSPSPPQNIRRMQSEINKSCVLIGLNFDI